MGIQRKGVDAYQTRKFLVRIDRIEAGDFVDCSPIEMEGAVSEYRTGTDPDHPSKQPGGDSFPDLTLTRGEMYMEQSELAAWQDKKERRMVEVMRLSHEGVEGHGYRLHGAFPRGHKSGDFDASSDDGLALESLTLAYERYERI